MGVALGQIQLQSSLDEGLRWCQNLFWFLVDSLHHNWYIYDDEMPGTHTAEESMSYHHESLLWFNHKYMTAGKDSWEALDCKEIQPVNPKGNQSWLFIGRTDAKAKTPILWPPDVKNWLIGKDPDAGKDWRQEKGTTEDEMVRWHHWLDTHEFEQASGVGVGQQSLACCSPWGHRVGHDWMTKLNWT